VAFALARSGADVVGLDFCEEMLKVARERGWRSTVGSKRADSDAGRDSRGGVQSPVHFLQGDAMKIPFSDGTFDSVTMAYGLRNLAAWEEGLSEMVRVAKSGGRLLVLDFGKPDNPIWRAIYFTYLRVMVPIFGMSFCRDASAYAYILESLKHYPA